VAGHCGRAGQIADARGRNPDAFDLGVACEGGWARAELLVVVSGALAVDAAGSAVRARVAATTGGTAINIKDCNRNHYHRQKFDKLPYLVGFAVVVDDAGSLDGRDADVVLAAAVSGTVPVAVALFFLTSGFVVVWVSVETSGTPTLGIVVDGAAAGVLPADVWNAADVLALSAAGCVVNDAGLFARAVHVILALVDRGAHATAALAFEGTVFDAMALGDAGAADTGLAVQALPDRRASSCCAKEAM
jgi:hypothetical protein